MIELNEEQIKKNWVTSSDKIKVSICCIAYNQELYISEAIDSFPNKKLVFLLRFLFLMTAA
jgi:hypothetical protein